MDKITRKLTVLTRGRKLTQEKQNLRLNNGKWQSTS
jgi:hypothetical protein